MALPSIAPGAAAVSAAVALLGFALVALDPGRPAEAPSFGAERRLVNTKSDQVLIQLPNVAIQRVLESFDGSDYVPLHQELPLPPTRQRSQPIVSLVRVQWHRWTLGPELKSNGISDFFYSAVLFDWGTFLLAVLIAVCLRWKAVNWLTTRAYYGLGLLCWLALGAAYNACIWWRLGGEEGQNWLAGYILEFVFLIENIFVFQVVVHAFNLPYHLVCKVLQLVVVGQILFEIVFFMGLAVTLRQLRLLPYILGAWLIFCGVLAICEDKRDEVDVMDSALVKALRSFCGERLDLGDEAREDGALLLHDEKGWRISVLGVVACVLLVADFLLEVDVVLTKIEEFNNPYIAFSSSAVAAFSIPELFFLSQGALNSVPELHYGIGAVLGLFGMQMLLSHVYVLQPWVSCVVVASVLASCVLFSMAKKCWNRLRNQAP